MANQPKLDLRVQGTSGLPVYGGRVYDEVLTELQGERGRRILREMSEQDPIVGGVLLGIEMLSREVPWTVNPANETEQAKKVADFVDDCLTDMSPTFGNTLSEILSMLVYGWSWLEILYKRRDGIDITSPLKSSRFSDGKIGWGAWSIRGQETLLEWLYSEKDHGEVIGLRQLAPPMYDTFDIPRSKSLHFKTRSRRENPEGVSILRNAYRPWYMKKNIEQIEGIGIERDLAGLPVLWAPDNLFAAEASDEEKSLLEQLRKIVTSIKRDEQEGILMPMAYDEEGKNPLYKLELLSTGGDRQFDTNSVINRYDERIAMSMLADFILMGHQAVGSFALSTTKTGLFTMALSAIMDIITEEINTAAIPQLVLLNGWSLKLVPTLSHGKIEGADLGKLGAFLQALSASGMGIFPNPELEKYLLEQAGLPTSPDALGATTLPLAEANDGEPTGQPQPQPVAPPATTTPPAPLPKTRQEQQPKAAHESRSHHRHFTPLSVRVSKVSNKLSATMLPEEYRALLEAVMAAGKFSSLSKHYQEAILAAEGAGS